MLQRLCIKNIVLIESCDIAFARGLCVLSGETGAGKSILLDALGLALGERSDLGLIRKGEAQGSVSAEFDVSKNIAAKEVMRDLALEGSDTLVIRRTLGSDGKTRCVANDQTVTVAALKKLGETLVEVHGQHDQRTLQDATVHRELLDDYGKLEPARLAVAKAHSAWWVEEEALALLKSDIEKTMREQEYLEHMRGELKKLAPQPGEEEMLTNQRTAMMQSEKLFEVINEAIGELNRGKSAAAAIRSAQRVLTRSALAGHLGAIIEGLEKAAIEAEEASYALEKAGEAAIYNPEKLERIEERLFALKAAGRKYNLPVDELANLQKETEEKLALISSQEHRLKELEKQAREAKNAFAAAAEKLSAQRKKAAAKLEKTVEAELAPLKMAGTRFHVRIDRLAESGWSAWGVDGIRFECATNVIKAVKDVAFAPLSKIASGGELSRFMLAMKVALMVTRQAPTVIFDEIDAGTGGAVADAIGARLALLGKNAQVLVVTHLPQVAARGTQHLLISKKEQAKKITTQVEELSANAREEELARMLAGAKITNEARKAAQKLLEEAA